MESPNSSYYLLRWSDHISNYAEMFLTLREQEEFVDCSIACEDGVIGAHRLVLAGCSPYMRDLLKRSSNPHPIIFLLDVSRSTVLLLMEFIYRGQAHIPHSRLRQLVTLGKALKIKGLSQVFIPDPLEPIQFQIPRLHGIPDPVCDDDSHRLSGLSVFNGSSQGGFLSTPQPSESDYPIRDPTCKDVNNKEIPGTLQKNKNTSSNNKTDDHFEGCDEDTEGSVEEGREVECSPNNTHSLTNGACNHFTSQSKVQYIPKPKSKQMVKEVPETRFENSETLLSSPRKHITEEMSHKKPTVVDKLSCPVTGKRKLDVDHCERPTNKEKQSAAHTIASPKNKNVTSSTKKRSVEVSVQNSTKKVKISKEHSKKPKIPVYKVKKGQFFSKFKVYNRKQTKLELATYGHKNGYEATKRYALSKYGVKIRAKSFDKLIALYPVPPRGRKKNSSMESSCQKRPVGRPRKITILSAESGDNVDQQSSVNSNNGILKTTEKGELLPLNERRFPLRRKRSLSFNLVGLFGKGAL